MPIPTPTRSLALLLALALGSPAPAAAQPPTSFPFGGTLVLDQQPVDTEGRPGAYDFTFRAFDSPRSQRQLGPTVERPGLPLSEGRFETRLDFGADVLAPGRIWIETTVTHRRAGSDEVVARSRQEVTVRAAAPPTTPVTSDAEILSRLPAVRVVISDRQTPGQAHFVVDEESFRRAFGVGSPVTATDLSAVGIVAASQLRRELVASQQRIRTLEADLGRLRFRLNLTLLLLAVVVLSVFVQRRSAAPGAADADGHAAADGGTRHESGSEGPSPSGEAAGEAAVQQRSDP